jgi:N-acetylglucosaminyldiphosphoundecaprenol N-acetyl-beta-D-mannosaminyltransferase
MQGVTELRSRDDAGRALAVRPYGRRGASVLGTFIDAVSWQGALEGIGRWASARESRYVCVCNAHSVVTTRLDSRVRSVISNADMATADGMPVAWMLRRLGYPHQERINGPDLMWRYCAIAAERGQSVYLYGNTPETLKALRKRLRASFPNLDISGSHAPPFRDLTAEEDARMVARINQARAAVVFVSLGCPKQELWMAEHRGRVHSVMIGVGMAFGYHAGTMRRAPACMQKAGLEWLYRLCSEPGRLWRRYLVTNTAFVLGAARQIIWERRKNLLSSNAD